MKTPGPGTLRALLSGLALLGLLTPALHSARAAEAPPEAATTIGTSTTAAPEPTPPADPAAPEVEDKEAAEDAPAEETPEESPPGTEAAPGDYRNWFITSVGGLIVDGDKAAAQRRSGLPASAFGGIESLHYEHDVGKKGLFKVDGRGIFGNEDYDLRLEWSETDKAFVRGGLSQRRNYSDGSGGWFPGNNQWFSPYDDRLELVRGNVFFEAGLRLPGKPELTIRYDHDWRDGLKDSTMWGDTGLTGGAGIRSIVPAFYDLDEESDTLSIDLRHTLGKTTFGAGFSYEQSDLQNSRNFWRRPGETSDRHVTQKETVESDLLNARAFVDTTFNDKFRLTSAYSFTTLETDISGSRIVGTDYDPIYDPVYGRRDVGFLGLAGTTQLDQHVWNVNLLWNPFANLAVIPAFRLENQAVDGSSSWTDTGAGDVARAAANTKDMVDLSQQLEVRYTGVTNVVLYARGDWVQGDGNLLETERLMPSQQIELRRDSDFDRFSQKYSAGANWYPAARISFHAQYYHKQRDNDYSQDPAATVNFSGAYPGFIQNQSFTTDDANFRVTWRPLDKLTLITRYDFQYNTIDMEGVGLAGVESSRNTAHILSETITWTPINRLYIQPGVNYVLDTTKSAATSAVTFPGSPVDEASNDYLNLTCTVGVVLDDRTDLQAQYTYYLADNFRDISAYSQPYGADTEEHGIVATLIRRISPRLKVSLRYGFFTSRDDLSGGFNDYDAHLVYASTQYLF